MRSNKLLFNAAFALLVAFSLSSCSGGKGGSSTTGWKYNDPDWGGYEVQQYEGQVTGPGLVIVEGGTFVMGQTEEDVMGFYDAVPTRVTVNSFYIDQTEVSNLDYREYLYWLKRMYAGESGQYPEIWGNALPDSLVWRDELAYNEPYVEYYLRHPAYQDYPVVGVSWLQAVEYCKWRTDRVNEFLLVDKGVLNMNVGDQTSGPGGSFDTESYLLGLYDGDVRKNLPDLDPSGDGERPVRFEDGILLPAYRLPTEAEWEYAALGLVGNQPYGDEERFTDKRIYPWDGTSLRYPKGGGWQGMFMANFKRGSGDYMGLAGNLNDNASVTAPVMSFWPNDYGIYNMAGNVNEWVADAYRPTSLYDVNDFNPYRGNVFTTKETTPDGEFIQNDTTGRIVYIEEKEEDLVNRRNYKKADVINYLDGDEPSEVTYSETTSLVNDKARVYKGGSWNDMAYWLSPGARRYLDQEMSTATIGFRCAMDRVGSPAGNNSTGGNQFKKR